MVLTPNILDLIGTIILAGALVVTIVTFYVTFRRGKKAEQMKIAHDIMRDFSTAEDKTLNTNLETEENEKEWKLRHLQYLNVCEWLSFLVNHDELTEDNIKKFFKPMLLRDHKTVLGHPKLQSYRNDPSVFTEFKELYKKWST